MDMVPARMMDSSIQTGGRNVFRRFDPNFPAPLSQGCDWLLSLKLGGLAKDSALRHRAGLKDHASLVPAPPVWDFDHEHEICAGLARRALGFENQDPEPRSQVRYPMSAFRCPHQGNEPLVSSLDYDHDYDDDDECD